MLRHIGNVRSAIINSRITEMPVAPCIFLRYIQTKFADQKNCHPYEAVRNWLF
jgi:hypothetical protein